MDNSGKTGQRADIAIYEELCAADIDANTTRRSLVIWERSGSRCRSICIAAREGGMQVGSDGTSGAILEDKRWRQLDPKLLPKSRLS